MAKRKPAAKKKKAAPRKTKASPKKAKPAAQKKAPARKKAAPKKGARASSVGKSATGAAALRKQPNLRTGKAGSKRSKSGADSGDFSRAEREPDLERIGRQAHTSVSSPSAARVRDAVPAARTEPDLERIGRQAQISQGKSIGMSDDRLQDTDPTAGTQRVPGNPNVS